MKKAAAARKNLAIDEETAYQTAYQAMLKGSLALMLSHGQRPRVQLGHHVAIIEFAQNHLDPKWAPMLALFDRMRRKRNEAFYDLGIVSIIEAEEAVRTVESYLQIVGTDIEARLPQSVPEARHWAGAAVYCAQSAPGGSPVKKIAALLLVLLPLTAAAQNKKAPTDLRGVLLEQLHNSHDAEDWYVPVSIAVEGLTAEQAQWKPAGKDAHSVGQLAYHIWYWDQRSLAQFKGEKVATFDGNNNETFDNFNAAQWDDLVKKLNQVLADWETAVQGADDAKLAANASLIAHIGAHNAYHVGQILYVRKLEGAWNPDKGVK